ncbi:hypothetical protein [Oceanimonas smirnovii]|uniref:Uncharacterized protein n=1 Tax=Oceanimonas smirnovii TaxID=264574 RepID=A0ABW7NZA0_9GAMM
MTKGKDLPPLPPIEYCTIERAAKLLDCEISDIIHWGAIKAISLAIRLSDVQASVYLDKNDQFLIETENKIVSGEELTWKEMINSQNWYGRYSLFVVERAAEEGEPTFPSPCDDGFGVIGRCNGLWGMDSSILKQLEGKESITVGVVLGFNLFPLVHDGVDRPSVVLFPDPGAGERINLTINDIWITKPDLTRIYQSLISGEEMENVHNNDKMAKLFLQQEKEKVKKAPRGHINQFRFIKALLESHPSIDHDSLSKPGRLCEELGKIFSSAGLTTIPPDEKTLKDWLSKAG